MDPPSQNSTDLQPLPTIPSLLSLPDEALRCIFLALCPESAFMRDVVWFGQCHGLDSALKLSAARSLASCCSRLDTVYRSSVRTLILTQNYSETDCNRLLARFPRTVALDIDLRNVPGFERPPFSHRPWTGTPAAYPNGLVWAGIRSISLSFGGLHPCDVHRMLKDCTRLETLELFVCNVVKQSRRSRARLARARRAQARLDGVKSENLDVMSALSLERYGTTLKKLVVKNSAVSSPQMGVGFHCIPWSNLSALRHLELYRVAPSGGYYLPLAVLAELSNLQYISLADMEIEDMDILSLFPLLPKVNSVRLAHCPKLSFRVLQWLPLHLNSLDVSGTRILSLHLGGDEEESSDSGETLRASKSREEKRIVKVLIAKGVKGLCFDSLLRIYTAASVSHLDLRGSTVPHSNELVRFLFRAPNVLKLDLRDVQYRSLDDRVLASSISQLASLCELDGKPWFRKPRSIDRYFKIPAPVTQSIGGEGNYQFQLIA